MIQKNIASTEKGVKWESMNKRTSVANNKRKLYSTRDQPTWKNCKLSRPPRVRHELHAQNDNRLQSTPTEKNISELFLKNSSPQPCTSPKNGTASLISSMWESGRSSSSSRSSQIADQLHQAIHSDDASSSLNVKHERGRDVMKEKARNELILAAPSRFQTFESTECDVHLRHNGGCMTCVTPARKKSLTNFRISSVESDHRSSDVSIGLRQMSRLSHTSKTEQIALKDRLQRRSSECLLLSLTKITSQNIEKSTRQSAPLLPLRSTVSYDFTNSKTLAPGEGYVLTRRRSSVSAPATHGTESNSVPSDNAVKKSNQRYRKLPGAFTRPNYADREWRPTILQKYSLNLPWAPKQQTTRYFPKYSNLQDAHLRNPYLVPGSVLYRAHTVYH